MKKLSNLYPVVLVVSLLPAWLGHARHREVRERHDRLMAEMVVLGIGRDDSNSNDGSGRSVPRVNSGRQREVVDTASLVEQFRAVLRDMHEMAAEGEEDAGFKQMKRMHELVRQVQHLRRDQWEPLIDELMVPLGDKISAHYQVHMVGLCLYCMVPNQPGEVLDYLLGSDDRLELLRESEHVLKAGISTWAEQNPEAATRWFRQMADGKIEESWLEDMQAGLLTGMAKTDPAMALRLMGDLGADGNRGLMKTIVTQARTPEQRTGMLQALRNHVQQRPSAEGGPQLQGIDDAYAALAFGSERAGFSFHEATTWIDSAGLTTEELSMVVSGMGQQVVRQDQAQWTDWLAGQKQLDRRLIASRVGQILSQWVYDDVEAAGEWVGQLPEGETRVVATSHYATSIANEDPVAATEWAMTMPAGERRQEVLSTIHGVLVRSGDAHAAGTFAETHGLR